MVITSMSSSSKWAALVASAWIQCFAGGYTFGIFSPLLKSSQGYDQSTLDLVALFGDIGGCFGIPAGLLSSSRIAVGRPWLVLTVGAVLGFVGYLLVWLSVIGAVPQPPVALMCLYMLLAGHAMPYLDTANVVTAVGNFPESRGTVVGIMKSFWGLSGAVLTHVYWTLLGGDQSSFILMLALLPNIVTLLLMGFVKVHHGLQGSDKPSLDSISIITLTIAGYLMVVTLMEHLKRMSSVANFLVLAVLLLLVVSPVAIVLKIYMTESKILSESYSPERLALLYEENRDNSAPSKLPLDPEETPTKQEQILEPSGNESSNLVQAMTMLDFWLFLLSLSCGVGSGTALFDNMSQVGGSLGYTTLQTSSLVSLWSIWNFLGRFSIGYISDYFLQVKGYARTFFVVLTLAIMSLGHAVVSSGLPGSLYIGSVLVGLCYGSQWALLPSITSEIFGLKHFGTIYNTISIASPLGSYILSVKVVGYIYDKETSSSSSTKSCLGRHCFMLSFMIMSSVCLLGVTLALILWYRTRRVYHKIVD